MWERVMTLKKWHNDIKKNRRHKIKILTDYQKQNKNFNMENNAIKKSKDK